MRQHPPPAYGGATPNAGPYETPYTLEATAPLVDPYVVNVVPNGNDATGDSSEALPFATLKGRTIT